MSNESDWIKERMDRLEDKIDKMSEVVLRGEGRPVLCGVMQQCMDAIEKRQDKQRLLAGVIAAGISGLGILLKYLF